MKLFIIILLFCNILNINADIDRTQVLELLFKKFDLPINSIIHSFSYRSNRFFGDHYSVIVDTNGMYPLISIKFIINPKTNSVFPFLKFDSKKYNFNYFNVIKQLYNDYIVEQNIQLQNDNLLDYLNNFESIFNSRIIYSKRNFISTFKKKYQDLYFYEEYYKKNIATIENENINISIQYELNEIEIEYYSYIYFYEHLVYRNTIKIKPNGEIIEFAKNHITTEYVVPMY